MRASTALATILLAGTPGVASGQTPVAVGGEFQVNTYTTTVQSTPSIASDSLGGFIVVWRSSGGQDGSDSSIQARRLGRRGTLVGAAFQVNSYTTDFQTLPAVAADGSGGFVAVWRSTGQDGSSASVHGQRFDAANDPLGSEFLINTYTTGPQSFPEVAVTEDGEFVVSWDSQYYYAGTYQGVLAQRFDSVGSPVGGELLVSITPGDLTQSRSDVGFDDEGRFVVAWSSETYSPGYLENVHVGRFDSTGSPLGVAMLVNTYTTEEQNGARLAVEGSGDFTVVWTSEEQDGDGLGVFARRFDSSGVALGGEFQVNTYTTFDQRSVSIAEDGEGGFLVVWASDGQDGDGWGVHGQRLDSTGAEVGEEFQVNTYTTMDQLGGSVAADSRGGFVVVWASDGPGGYLIQGQRFVVEAEVFADGFESGDVTGWSASVGAVGK